MTHPLIILLFTLKTLLPAPMKGVPEQILQRKAYTTSYNKETRCPNWVAWCLTAEHTDGNTKRPGNAFHADTEVPEPRADLIDYRHSGWSRGHMCPAGDCKWDNEAMYESFLFTNICPQHPSSNSGDWNEIEQSCRKWAKKHGDLYIVCGPLYLKKRQDPIGPHKIAIPDAFFKVILCMNGKPKGIGFICRNNGENRKKDFYVNSIDEIERIMHMDFFPALPDSIENIVEAQRDITSW